ncbi:cycloheximide resistance protein [Gaeumannomyces tritici R3-111a-1]|uniref:Cycloheximide resistance protein n=1 Tax=Gaeumannomyces tritici (strain R3-111a-1) TaxID=644352 RepID=J3NI27_GAET3|nr:cycloheximide resistance protein [Gaeumannomyces tritici R3-111a-1]EJT80920.1 cycloheximide resistance protein [Gaeumannomyces tritici R3-111a-1]
MAMAPANSAHSAEQDVAIQRQRSIDQAVDEGHDADIPSDLGYVLSETASRIRRSSNAAPSIKKPKHSSVPGVDTHEGDVEKNTGGSSSTPNDVATASEEEEEEGEDSANIVWWDDNDPQNPYNWPTWRKVLNCGLVSCLTFLTPLASSVFAPGVPQLMREFKSTNTELAAFVVSIYVLGFAFGPLLLAPLSEIYGRTILYHICNLGFIAFVIGCALAPTLEALIVFRFFSGLFGSCPITNGGGTIADMIPQEKRAAAMSVFTIGPLLGPIIGPVIGGFLADVEGWRWNFWLLAILGGFIAICMILVLRETYAPVLLQRKTQKLRAETGNANLRSKLDIGLSPRDYFSRSIVRPLKMLAFSPVCQIFSIYIAIVYGYLYLMFTSITPVFEQYYGFTTSNVGLVFLGMGVGSMLGLLYYSLTSDGYSRKMAAADGQGMKPEYRLKLLPLGALILPAGFFLYGWTAEYRVHWIVPILGHVLIGIANLIIFMSMQLYLVDTFSMYAASALAANTVVRSVAGAVLPLVGIRMYNVLGLGWGNSLLGFIALVMVPGAFALLRYGEYLRTRFQVKNL